MKYLFQQVPNSNTSTEPHSHKIMRSELVIEDIFSRWTFSFDKQQVKWDVWYRGWYQLGNHWAHQVGKGQDSQEEKVSSQ